MEQDVRLSHSSPLQHLPLVGYWYKADSRRSLIWADTIGTKQIQRVVLYELILLVQDVILNAQEIKNIRIRLIILYKKQNQAVSMGLLQQTNSIEKLIILFADHEDL